MVSHDKYFLNRMVTKIVELYQQQLHVYNGNFDFFEKEKAIRTDLQQKAFENQQDYIRQNERLVERFRAKASKAAMAQSLIKKLEKLDRIEEPQIERPNIKINFRVDKTPGKVLVELKNISKSFGETVIVEHTSAEIERGDKIALIGANGKGKSTLLRIIAGTEKFTGDRKWGHNVEEAFYAQHQLEALNINNTVLDEMKECGSQKTELELRTLLGCFLFSGDDVEKKIKVLSGGEKARVALAKTMISKANFLLLDEPTNHLDMHSADLLIEALNKYEGSFILVSHDRYFISKTANKIWEIVDHKIKEFKGGYEEYVAWKERMEKAEKGEKANEGKRSKEASDVKGSKEVKGAMQVKGSKEAKASNNPVTAPQTSNREKEVKKELQKQQRIFQELEEKIATLKGKKQQLEAALGALETYSDKNKFIETESEYKKLSAELSKLNTDYEKVFEKIMELENQ
ncbi:MAG TPA: ABC-F family ATP-binding cassette domain-containing protein, partial [Chitinophagaceae bacterium]|nr:ABC-F family ATP-binding cassette domain-containing protein [Chitinophagaceae bacterium]